MSPLSNAYLNENNIHKAEMFFPLHAFICEHCFLVQLEEFESPENIFVDYAYFSSYSQSWLEHVKSYTEHVTERFNLDSDSRVFELASNDGYLLQYFLEKNIPVTGIEPAGNVADVAIANGIPTIKKFFSTILANELVREDDGADLIVANNVLAHVPDLHGFIEGIRILLKPNAVVTIEFPHLLKLLEQNQFDTIYHEHFSYFSLLSVMRIFEKHGLRIFDVDLLPTHGGSLRIYGCHNDSIHVSTSNVDDLLITEKNAGLDNIKIYKEFSNKAVNTKCEVLSFFVDCKRQNKTVVGYGAPAKGNTLLNYCGIGRELLPYTTDRNPHKQGQYLPGTHIPIETPEKIFVTKPDYVFILPWNLRDEIVKDMNVIREWGGKFVVPIPNIEIF